MAKKVETIPRGLTRREVIVGAATVALAARVPFAAAAPLQRVASGSGGKATAGPAPMRRYLAAAATLGDGRVLITGGYDRPFDKRGTPTALSTAMIYDPTSDQWSQAAAMSMPRARHAAVTLADGRVAVLGGISMNPTASVEIYDPRTDSWSTGTPMAQPRYDHAAASVGSAIYVLGGSSQSMLSSVEVVHGDVQSSSSPL